MIKFLKEIFFDKTLNHIITWNQDVVTFPVGNFDIHLFVGIKVFHDNGSTGLFFKVGNDVFTDIFSRHIDVKCLAGIW